MLPQDSPKHLVAPDAAPEAPPAPARWSPPRGHRALRTGSPDDVLARLVLGDPLDLARLARERRDAHATALDPERIERALAARIAHAAGAGPGLEEAPGREFYVHLADEVVLELVERDRRAFADAEGDEEDRRPFDELGRAVGVGRDELGSAFAAFHSVDREDRMSLIACIKAGGNVESAARGSHPSLVRMGQGARRALAALLRGAGTTRGGVR